MAKPWGALGRRGGMWLEPNCPPEEYMAIKGKRGDEGGSGAERKGRVPSENDEMHAESPYGDIDLARDLEEMERQGLDSGNLNKSAEGTGESESRRREAIGANPDLEEELAEESLAASSDDEDEAQTHDRRRH
jgi:hypothetical protein